MYRQSWAARRNLPTVSAANHSELIISKANQLLCNTLLVSWIKIFGENKTKQNTSPKKPQKQVKNRDIVHISSSLANVYEVSLSTYSTFPAVVL